MQSITLNDLLDLLLAKLKWLLVAFVCGAVVFSVYTLLFVEDEYTASVSLYVQNTEDSNGIATTNNLYASRMLTNSFAVVLSDVETLERATRNMTVPATPSEVAGALSIHTSSNTAIITVTARTNDALRSQAICEAVAGVAPEMLEEVIGAGTITALGNVPMAVKTGPNVLRNGILGAFGALLLMALVFFLIYLMDITIKSKEDLQRATTLPVLGEIPTLEL